MVAEASLNLGGTYAVTIGAGGAKNTSLGNANELEVIVETTPQLIFLQR